MPWGEASCDADEVDFSTIDKDGGQVHVSVAVKVRGNDYANAARAEVSGNAPTRTR